MRKNIAAKGSFLLVQSADHLAWRETLFMRFSGPSRIVKFYSISHSPKQLLLLIPRSNPRSKPSPEPTHKLILLETQTLPAASIASHETIVLHKTGSDNVHKVSVRKASCVMLVSSYTNDITETENSFKKRLRKKGGPAFAVPKIFKKWPRLDHPMNGFNLRRPRAAGNAWNV